MRTSATVPILLLTSLLASFYCAAADDVKPTPFNGDAILNTHVSRMINLTTHIEEIQYGIEFKNLAATAVDYYLFPISAAKFQHVSFVHAVSLLSSKDKDKIKTKPLKTAFVTVSGCNVKGVNAKSLGWLKISLDAPLKTDATGQIGLHVVLTRTIRPFPAEITQNENQRVVYEDTMHALSAYRTTSQTTVVRLASSKIESSSKKSGKVSGDTIEYGPFAEVEPLAAAKDDDSVEPLNVHFESNYPFVTMTSMKKLIEVSHYGNINVEEWYVLEHTGARLKGSFSRYEYQRTQTKAASFRHITAILPPHSTGLYYRDQIGNVSTSHVHEGESYTTWDVEPRFPMFGGWKTDFYIGYNLPASDYVSISASDSSTYILNISFGSPFPQAAIDMEELRVILPEFATDLKFVTPFEIDDASQDSLISYLDTVGRSVLVLKKRNVVRYHDQPFQVIYTYQKAALLQEPLILVMAFFMFFMASMAYVRIQLSLSDDVSGAMSGVSYQVRRVDRIGQVIGDVVAKAHHVINVLTSLCEGGVGGVSEAKLIDRLTALVAAVKSPLEDLKKEASLSEIAESLSKLLNDSKVLAKSSKPAERSRLRDKISSIDNTVTRLANA